MKNRPKLSVIIATYNRPFKAANLKRQINAVNKNVEVIIVDQDPVRKGIRIAKHGNYTYVKVNKANLAHARNVGYRLAKNDIVLFLDDDVKITRHTLSEHLNEYRSQRIVGVAGRVINENDNLSSTNLVTGKMNKFGTKFSMNFFSTKRQFVDFPYGCNMSFRKNTLDRIGGFDENFVPPLSAFEEIDVALRLKKYGQLIFSPHALVYHIKSKTGGTRLNNDSKIKLYYESYGYFLMKNIAFPLSLMSFLIRLRTAFSESFSATSYFLKGYRSYRSTIK